MVCKRTGDCVSQQVNVCELRGERHLHSQGLIHTADSPSTGCTHATSSSLSYLHELSDKGE